MGYIFVLFSHLTIYFVLFFQKLIFSFDDKKSLQNYTEGKELFEFCLVCASCFHQILLFFFWGGGGGGGLFFFVCFFFINFSFSKNANKMSSTMD